MNKNNHKKSMKLSAETIRVLGAPEIQAARGGGMCSTGALTGPCPTQSVTCPTK